MKKNVCFFLIGASLISACHNHNNDYINAKQSPVLKTPTSVTSPVFQDSHPIPKQESTITKAPNLTPPGYDADLQAAKKLEQKKS